MRGTGRPGLSAGEKQELWGRWRDGQSLCDVGRALGKHAGSVFGVLSAHGGMAPPQRARSRLSLSLQEREEISRGLMAGLSFRQIGLQLNRSPSTISREVDRNRGRVKHRAARADEQSWERTTRPKRCLLARHQALQAIVAAKLQEQWSPAQISDWQLPRPV